MKNPVQFSLEKTFWLYANMIFIFFINFQNVSFSSVLISMIISIFTISLGHSIGLHRGIIHKSYETSKTFRNIQLFLFVLTGMGSPLKWIKLHYVRDFWQNQKTCHPYLGYQHSLAKDYVWYLHYSYIPTKVELKNCGFPFETEDDKFIQFLDKTWWIFSVIPAILVWQFWGFQPFIILFPLRITINLLMHWFIGYLSHTHGYRKYEIPNANESGYNNWFLGLISFGEGFHNNHHAFPSSSKFGVKWFEFDLSWIFIIILRKLKIIWNVKLPDEHTKKENLIILENTKWK